MCEKAAQTSGRKVTLGCRILRILSVPPPCPHRAPTLGVGWQESEFSILRKGPEDDCLKYRLGGLTELSPVPFRLS